MVHISIDRPPIGERDARALVEAIVESDDRIEHHYLEVKSDLDISTKRDQAKLAKFILGAANRMPDKAAVAFGGYAVMAIGVAQNAMTGISPVEVLEIERAVKPFLGADGPHWDVVRVPVAGSDKEVLLLLIDPPTWGQPPFICLKEGGERNELRDGAIYFRARGETREAKSDELAQLLRRGTASTVAPKVHVDLTGTAFAVDYDALERVREDYIEHHKSRLLLALQLAKNPQPKPEVDGPQGIAAVAGALASQSSFFGVSSHAESRSEDEYRVEIVQWVQRVRDVWPEAMERFLGSSLPGTDIEVTNDEDIFFEDAEVRVHLAGEVFGVPMSDAELSGGHAGIGIPRPPRPWGPTTTSFMDAINAGPPAWIQGIDASGLVGGAARSSWRNTGSVDLDFELEVLRPRRTERSDDLEVVLVTKEAGITSFDGTWEITARGHHAVYSGAVTVSVEIASDLPQLLREVLGVRS